MVHPKTSNMEYNPSDLEEPSRIISEVSAQELISRPIIVAQRGYLSYISGAEQYYAPFTDYSGLVKYLRLNNAHFLYISYRRLGDYPFVKEFSNDATNNEFKLLYSGSDSQGMPIKLYRFKG